MDLVITIPSIVGVLVLIPIVSMCLFFKFCRKVKKNEDEVKLQDDFSYGDPNYKSDMNSDSKVKMSKLMETQEDHEFMKSITMVEVISPTDRSSAFINVDLITSSNCDDEVSYEIPERSNSCARSNSFANPLFEEHPLPKRLVEQKSFEIDETSDVYQGNVLENNLPNQSVPQNHVTVHAVDVNIITDETDISGMSIITLNEFDQFQNSNERSITITSNSSLNEYFFNVSLREDSINKVVDNDIERNNGSAITGSHDSGQASDESSLKKQPFYSSQYNIDLSHKSDSFLNSEDVSIGDASQGSFLSKEPNERSESFIYISDTSYVKPINVSNDEQFPNSDETSQSNSRNTNLIEEITESHVFSKKSDELELKNDPFDTSQYKIEKSHNVDLSNDNDFFKDTEDVNIINVSQRSILNKESIDLGLLSTIETPIESATGSLSITNLESSQSEKKFPPPKPPRVNSSEMLVEVDLMAGASDDSSYVTPTDASQESIIIDKNREKIIQNIDASYDKPVILSNDEDSIITSNEINQFLNSNERNSDSNQTSDDSKFKIDISHEVELSTDNYSFMNTEDVSISDVSQEAILKQESLDQELLPAIESPIESTTAIDLNSSTGILANVDLMTGASDDSTNGDFCKLSSFGSQDTLEKVDSMENLDDSFIRINENETENSIIDSSSSDVTTTSSIITVETLSELNISNDIQSSEDLLSNDNKSGSFIDKNTDHDKIDETLSSFRENSNEVSIDDVSQVSILNEESNEHRESESEHAESLLVDENSRETIPITDASYDQPLILSTDDSQKHLEFVENMDDSFIRINVNETDRSQIENENSLRDTSEIPISSGLVETNFRKNTLQEDSLDCSILDHTINEMHGNNIQRNVEEGEQDTTENSVSSQRSEEAKFQNDSFGKIDSSLDFELSNVSDSLINSKDVSIDDVSQVSIPNEESNERRESESEHAESLLVDENS